MGDLEVEQIDQVVQSNLRGARSQEGMGSSDAGEKRR